MRRLFTAATTLILVAIIFSAPLSGVYVQKMSSETAINEMSQSKDGYDLLIITPSEFAIALQPLITHKDSHGVRTILATLDEVYNGDYFTVQGRDDAEKVKYFIKDALEAWGVKYVMLVGGKDTTPARYVHIINSTAFISDLYFADIYCENGSFCSWDSNNNGVFGEMNDTTVIDNVDLNPDVYIGRILCSTPSEVETVVNKIIYYENNTFDESWFNNLILFGGDTHPYPLMESVLPHLFGMKGGIAWEGEYMGDKVAEYLDGFNAKKFYASRLLKADAIPLTKQNVEQAINDGAGFLLFNGHGQPMKVATHPPFSRHIWMPFPAGYELSDVKNLSNREKLSVAVFDACSCGDLNSSSGPIAWEFVKHENGGAIASFASTTDANLMPGTLCTETLLGYLTMDIFKLYSEGKDTIGEIWGSTIKDYLDDDEAMQLGSFNITLGPIKITPNQVWTNYLTMEEWILFGDPSLKIGGYPKT